MRIIIYTDDVVHAVGAASLLSSAQFEVIAADPDLSELVPLVQRISPGLVLVDFAPEMTLGLFSALRQAAPAARLVLWGRSFSDELLEQGRGIGIAGFLNRNCSKEQFVRDLVNLAGGGELVGPKSSARSTKVNLTPREGQLVTLLAQGLKNKEIGSCLGITEGTVRIYLSKLFLKIGARDRFEVAVFGLKNAYCGQASWDGQNGFVTDADQGRATPVLRSLLLVEPSRRRGYTKPEAPPHARVSGV